MEIGVLVKRYAYFFSNQDIDSYTGELKYAYDGRFPDRLKQFGNQSITPTQERTG